MEKSYTTTTNSKKPDQWVSLWKKAKPALKKPKVIAGLVIVAVLILSLGLTILQTQQSQETRSDASGGSLPAPNVKLTISTDGARSHDEDLAKAGLQLSEGNIGLIDIKLDPKGLPVIGVELFAQYNPEKIEISNKRANIDRFTKFAQINKIGANQLRLLVLISPDQIPFSAGEVSLGNIQVKLKEPLTNSVLTLTKANFIVDHPSSLRQISGLASSDATTQSHAVAIEPKIVIQPSATPTTAPTRAQAPSPTHTPTPPPNTTNVPNVSLSGSIVEARTVAASNGDITATYKLTQSTPTDWQVNVIAVPSNQSSAPATADKRIKSTNCKNVASGSECQITIPATDLAGKANIFMFANQFKTYDPEANTYYCNWENGGSWKVADANHNSLTDHQPTTTCRNHTLDKILKSSIATLPTPTSVRSFTPTLEPSRVPLDN